MKNFSPFVFSVLLSLLASSCSLLDGKDTTPASDQSSHISTIVCYADTFAIYTSGIDGTNQKMILDIRAPKTVLTPGGIYTH